LSRQNLYPCKKTPWIVNSTKAIIWIRKENHTLITSVGLSTWEVLITLGLKYSLKQIVIIPADSIEQYNRKLDYYKNQFDFDNSISTLPLILQTISKNELLFARDEKIIELSDVLLPVSIRKNGNFHKKLKETKKIINDNFSIPYNSKHYEGSKYQIEKIIKNNSFTSNNYLIHWTRRCKSNWPDENLLTYYLDIFKSDEYPRSGFETLRHIFDKRVIIASNRHMVKGFSCVSFTDSSVIEFVKLMKWRKRYVEYSFEPYGIGIEREYGILSGITKVTYVSDKKHIENKDSWKYQTIGNKGDWRKENEYRYKGDFDLSIVPEKKLVFFCAYKEEAEILRRDYGIITKHLFEN
jgi:hypothetical protein